MKTLKLFLVAAVAAVMTLAGASVASASGNRFATLNITTAAQNGTYDARPVHYKKRYRRYRQYRRRNHYKRRYRKYGYYKQRRYRRYRYSRHRKNRYYYRRPTYYGYRYGPSVHFRVPGFGFHFGY